MDIDLERNCNHEEVPFVECEDTCCCDCTNAPQCMYVCSDLGIYGQCNKYD